MVIAASRGWEDSSGSCTSQARSCDIFIRPCQEPLRISTIHFLARHILRRRPAPFVSALNLAQACHRRRMALLTDWSIKIWVTLFCRCDLTRTGRSGPKPRCRSSYWDVQVWWEGLKLGPLSPS